MGEAGAAQRKGAMIAVLQQHAIVAAYAAHEIGPEADHHTEHRFDRTCRCQMRDVGTAQQSWAMVSKIGGGGSEKIAAAR